MPDLLGIIVKLKKFLSADASEVTMPFENQIYKMLVLEAQRSYIIPYFQREIRWDDENLLQLIKDIRSRQQFLGNIVLTRQTNGNYQIIDGQQRITVLLMIIQYIYDRFSSEISVIHPCELQIESFAGFTELYKHSFRISEFRDEELNTILQSDNLCQMPQYLHLWDTIGKQETFKTSTSCAEFLENLYNCELNIVINQSDNNDDSIRYFMDINLKGKQLDTEDIFKGYLFKLDDRPTIRESFYSLKKTVTSINSKRAEYPLMTLIQDYFYCNLYADRKFNGLDFLDTFFITKQFKTHEENPQTFPANTHILEVINDRTYMLNAMNQMNKIAKVVQDVLSSDGPSKQFKELFSKAHESIDFDELRVIHNLMKKVLRDKHQVPKALIMKYILTVLLGNQSKAKEEYLKFYGVYLLSELFVIFENKKSKTQLFRVLKSETWYSELIATINAYFSLDNITDSKILAQYKFGSNLTEEDFRFHGKNLATIYNFFSVREGTVTISNIAQLHIFLNDDNAYSMEHFIFSQSGNMLISHNGYPDQEYKLLKDSKAYIKNLFNFIFIPREINDRLNNQWLPEKLHILNGVALGCSYSRMILNLTERLSKKMTDVFERNPEDCKTNFDSYFSRDFKDDYLSYAKEVLNNVIDHIKAT